MQMGPPNCLRRLCRHYAGVDGSRETPVFTCDAFDEIPRDILSGADLHEKPTRGQKNDVVYERAETSQELDELMDKILNQGGRLSSIAGR